MSFREMFHESFSTDLFEPRPSPGGEPVPAPAGAVGGVLEHVRAASGGAQRHALPADRPRRHGAAAGTGALPF